mmetsp:Transcript_65687/g.143392  ORF Transcript_65687/g.143392 Transcript_65687/m.143392 type:complete len:468 (+) Transcript_65687:3-1406(+)
MHPDRPAPNPEGPRPGERPDRPDGDGRPSAGRGRGRGAEPRKSLCRKFLQTGSCPYGDACKFSHDMQRRGVCNTFVLTGACRFGDTCKYRHDANSEERLRSLAYSGDTAKVKEALGRVAATDDLGVITSLAISYSNSGDAAGASKLFERIQTEGIKATEKIYVELAKTFAAGGLPNSVREVSRHMVELGLKVPMTMRSSLIIACAFGEGPKQAEEALREAQGFGFIPSPAAWNAIAKAYGLAGDPQGLRELMQWMQREGVSADKTTYDALVKACGQVPDGALEGDPVAAQQVIREMTAAGFEPDLYTYSVAGNPQLAHAMADAVQRGAVPRKHNPMTTFNLLVNAHAQVGDVKGAHAVVGAMRANGLTPNSITFGALLNAHALARDAQGAQQVYQAMERMGIAPNNVILNIMVKVHAVCGDREGTLAAVSRMQAVGIQPNRVTEGWVQSVLSADTADRVLAALDLDQ